MTRRSFLAASASVAAIGAAPLAEKICLFTDHLGGFSYEDVARMLTELKVAGPDLTVRKGGLVTPARAAEDFPKADRIFKDAGLRIPMITTSVTDADASSESLLALASRLGVEYYKPGYYRYESLANWQGTIHEANRRLKALAGLNRKLKLKAGLHNHAGDSVGCCVWDAWEALQGVDPQTVGFFFDPAQATIEGGKIGWNLAFRRAQPRLFMVAIKDYVWERTEKGPRTRWVPLGQGMVDWKTVWPLLKQASFPGPISLHIEYDPGGNTPTERYDRALGAAAKDLEFLRAGLAGS